MDLVFSATRCGTSAFLQNIYKELETDLGIPVAKTGEAAHENDVT